MLAGVTRSFGLGGNDMYIMKLSSTGSFEWSKSIGYANASTWDVAHDIRLTSDGGFIVACEMSTVNGVPNYGVLMKIDSTGAFRWAKSLKKTLRLRSVSLTNDEAFLVAGSNLYGKINECNLDCNQCDSSITLTA